MVVGMGGMAVAVGGIAVGMGDGAVVGFAVLLAHPEIVRARINAGAIQLNR